MKKIFLLLILFVSTVLNANAAGNSTSEYVPEVVKSSNYGMVDTVYTSDDSKVNTVRIDIIFYKALHPQMQNEIIQFLSAYPEAISRSCGMSPMNLLLSATNHYYYIIYKIENKDAFGPLAQYLVFLGNKYNNPVSFVYTYYLPPKQ